MFQLNTACRGFLTGAALCVFFSTMPSFGFAQAQGTDQTSSQTTEQVDALANSPEEEADAPETAPAQGFRPIEFSTGTPLNAAVAGGGVNGAGFVILNQDRLFFESAYGKRALEELQEQARALQSENSTLTQDLEAEENELAQNRSNMEPDEFRRRADAFDEKVQAIRAAQDRKLQELGEQEEVARNNFARAIVPVLQAILKERGAAGILDSRVVLLPSPDINITDDAIRLVDQILGDGAE
ncbi:MULTISPECIES: OmpH family outer membrane protein [Halocynthiibacter]|uniref:OmpH family outer membrane protein n=1 Tax=Halocynthiibacter halioticoli TaxID=2986804 RepID=A0AAE3J0K8_9RHOB|nr:MULTISPECIES: OmpH family outer membrane protein [Halocynthiibacter]MCV6824316.1 OmpH family outer membrane protein [Halocynthiibacter halioticoli]MCW4057317.1 OmpH family outer membrane protein [Halocynthiibacter sp. SDUM655004]